MRVSQIKYVRNIWCLLEPRGVDPLGANGAQWSSIAAFGAADGSSNLPGATISFKS